MYPFSRKRDTHDVTVNRCVTQDMPQIRMSSLQTVIYDDQALSEYINNGKKRIEQSKQPIIKSVTSNLIFVAYPIT